MRWPQCLRQVFMCPPLYHTAQGASQLNQVEHSKRDTLGTECDMRWSVTPSRQCHFARKNRERQGGGGRWWPQRPGPQGPTSEGLCQPCSGPAPAGALRSKAAVQGAGAHRPELGHNCARERETGKGLGVPSRRPSPGPIQPTCCQQPGPRAPDPMSICAEKSLGARPAWPSQLDPSAMADAQGSQAAPAHPSSSSVPPEDLVTCALQLKTLQQLPAGGRARPHKQDRGEPVLASFQPHPRTGDAQGTHSHSPPVLATLRPQACICGSLAPPAGQARPCMRTQPHIGHPPRPNTAPALHRNPNSCFPRSTPAPPTSHQLKPAL